MGLLATTSFMKWTPSEGNKRGTGSGMTIHIQNGCQAELNFSALAHLIGDLRSNMLGRGHDVHSAEQALGCDEVHELDAANAQARARVAVSYTHLTLPTILLV